MEYYPKHYCGVFGIFGHPNAAELTYYGLYALQHRGQESAGIVTSDGRQFRKHKGMGLVSQIFNGEILHESRRQDGGGPHALFDHRLLALSATPNRLPWTARAARSPSRTMATSPTPPRSATNSKPRA